ncbi:hypothetical protein EX30DRAFT_343539 [Ascodesmis nigricans]|uniref:Reticulon-like protein n=1 Tax=Ascodesmis nigricans TaxID=341454 RepID=A0A4S2MRX3_9PEZI|nr:hypothetical protein EX30DRAFT_343539 [Ascodesmis nigricans]
MADTAAPHRSENAAQQVLNGTHPVMQDTKADIKGLANSAQYKKVDENGQPLSHFHSVFYDMFTWKFPKATGICFFSAVATILAFHYVNVLRYVFKAGYMLFAAAAAVELAGKPFGAKGVVSSMRPKRYWTVPRNVVDTVFDQVHDLLNFFVLEFQRILFVENIATTIAAFLTTFFGYFLIKYIPYWVLLLLTTTTAFTAPLIYLQNKQLIDEQLHRANVLINEKLKTGRNMTEKYAKDALTAAQATTADLSQKVQGYTARKSPEPAKPVASALDREFPEVPAGDLKKRTGIPEKHDPATDPILA